MGALCSPTPAGRCSAHGGQWAAHCATEKVLEEVKEHRAEQFARYGTNDDLEDGTGPFSEWTSPLTAYDARTIEDQFRRGYERHERATGAPTWMHLVREEVAEAFQEAATGRLRAELLQVAALCVSWIETLDGRL